MLLVYLVVQRKRNLAKRLPLGGKLSRSATDEGGYIIIHVMLTKPHALRSPNGREAAPYTAFVPPVRSKNFPTRPPPPRKAKQNFRSSHGGGLVGKFSVSEGGLEGESPVFQEGALSLQGLWSLVFGLWPFPYPPEISAPRERNLSTRSQ